MTVITLRERLPYLSLSPRAGKEMCPEVFSTERTRFGLRGYAVFLESQRGFQAGQYRVGNNPIVPGDPTYPNILTVDLESLR